MWRYYGRKIEREGWELEVGTVSCMIGKTVPFVAAGGWRIQVPPATPFAQRVTKGTANKCRLAAAAPLGAGIEELAVFAGASAVVRRWLVRQENICSPVTAEVAGFAAPAAATVALVPGWLVRKGNM